MRIILINDYSYVSGGSSQVAIQSARSLSQEGHDVTLFSAVTNIEEREEPYDVVALGQYDILSDPNRLRAIVNGVWNKRARVHLKKVLNDADPNNTIIHIHSWTKALSSSIFPCALCAGFKVVVTLHDYFYACPNGGFYNYNKNQICHKTPMTLSCISDDCDSRSYSHKLWRVLRQFIQNRAVNACGGVRNFITVSDFSEEVVVPYLGSGVTVYHVRNPILIAQQEPVDIVKNRSIIYVGRLALEKGVIEFAQAAKSSGLDVIFVGDGECRSRIKEIFPGANITGWLSPDEVYQIIRGARALVFPSLLYETQGMAVHESMAFGVPVIVSSGIAASRYVRDGRNGFVFERGDVSDLIRVLRKIENPDTVKELGHNAYADYWKNPSTTSTHVRELLSVYNGILAKD